MYPKNTVLNTARSAKLHSSLSSFVVCGEVISVLFVVCSFCDVVVESCCSVKSAYTLSSGTTKMIPVTIMHNNMMERIFFIPMDILIFLTIYLLLLQAFFLLRFICLYFITANTPKTHFGARCKYMARMVIFSVYLKIVTLLLSQKILGVYPTDLHCIPQNPNNMLACGSLAHLFYTAIASFSLPVQK